ncbi:GntR family transcriptional regulator [Flagellimonas sp. S3867]|uniref:GntR family transcriptional regulator n=1 Tax=Flagellimonas sp. S3867 TaxID=2768063 RepID=UPI001CC22AF3|nr:GntR family transcriptional regulator [Flagellimonas sp. S3867]
MNGLQQKFTEIVYDSYFSGMQSTSNLRDEVRSHLLDQIRKGELKIGKTINLAALARKIGISVTPIREALSQLEQARIIEAIPNRGFIVTRLSQKEARDLYGTIAQLEVMALENSSFDQEDLEKLESKRLELNQADNFMDKLHARFEFHKLLVHRCDNTVLLQILDDLKARLHFYEYGFARDTGFYANVDHQSVAIVEAIAEDNTPTAALILKMNWMSVLEYVEKRILATA